MARRDKRKKTLRKNTRRNSRRISRKNTLKNTKRNSKRKNTRRNSLRKNTLRKNLKKQRIQKKHKGGSGLSSAQQNKFWSTRKLKQGPDPNDPRNPTHGIYGAMLPQISTNQSMGPQPPTKPQGKPTSASPRVRRGKTTTAARKKFTEPPLDQLRHARAQQIAEAAMKSGPYAEYWQGIAEDRQNMQRLQRGLSTIPGPVKTVGSTLALPVTKPVKAATKKKIERRVKKAQLIKINEMETALHAHGLDEEWDIVSNSEGGIGGFYHVAFEELSQLQADDGNISHDDGGLKFKVDGQEYPVVIDYDDSKSLEETLETQDIVKLVELVTKAVDAKYDEEEDDAPGTIPPQYKKEMKRFKKEINERAITKRDEHKKTVERDDLDPQTNNKRISTYEQVKEKLRHLRVPPHEDASKNLRSTRISEAYEQLLRLDKRWGAIDYARQEINGLAESGTAAELARTRILEVIAAAHTHPDDQREIEIKDGVLQILSDEHLFATVNEYDEKQTWAKHHIVSNEEDYPGLKEWITGARQSAAEYTMDVIMLKICKNVNEKRIRGVQHMRSKVLKLSNELKQYIESIMGDIQTLPDTAKNTVQKTLAVAAFKGSNP